MSRLERDPNWFRATKYCLECEIKLSGLRTKYCSFACMYEKQKRESREERGFVQPYCEKCDKYFTTTRNYEIHMKASLVHKDDRG